MKLESTAFSHGERIPTPHTCEGEDRSPALRWSDAPEGTQSFALFVVDPDAPDGTFTHWVLFDLPPELEALPEGADGVGKRGRNDFQHAAWGGPCPPPNHGDHRYLFRLFALDLPSLELEDGAPPEEVEHQMRGHVLDRAELMGRYERNTS